MKPVRDPLDIFPQQAPERVVSLVPSTTGSLIDLGLGKYVVGVTDYCPAGENVIKVGGPKTPGIEAILNLRPDLVLANQEENSKEAIEAICSAGVPVWLSFPNTVQAMLADLWAIARLFRSEMAMDRTRQLEVAVEWAERASQDQQVVSYFCPIWEDRLETGECWWMSFNDQTYSNDVLRIMGGQNVFADRTRRYPLLADLGLSEAEPPGARDVRYPRVGLREVLDAQPEIILLPDEPYAYSEAHLEALMTIFAQTPACANGRVYTIDGSLITWPGTRLAQALDALPQCFS
jgi:ABC-type Fe3+-hydroxamate transport system substrate-binding protein